jgi:hypothetical protein
MDKKTFMTFNEYYEKYKPKNVIADNRSMDEIMAELLPKIKG